MKVNTIAHWKDIRQKNIQDKTVVIIDVFRATSSIVKALAEGADKIIAVQSEAIALDEYRKSGKIGCILSGEKNIHPIPGFHLGNSPQAYTSEIVQGKIIIMTTTNGTNAIASCISAKEILICAFLNYDNVARQLARINQETIVVCSGSRNAFSLDDAFCASALLNRLEIYTPIEYDDFSWFLKKLYIDYHSRKEKLLENCKAYNQLIKNGYKEDVLFCLKENIYQLTPKASGNTIS